jgi:hypothetical protein
MDISNLSVKEFYDLILNEYLVLKDYYARLIKYVSVNASDTHYEKEKKMLRNTKPIGEEIVRIKKRLDSLEQTINYFEIETTLNETTNSKPSPPNDQL